MRFNIGNITKKIIVQIIFISYAITIVIFLFVLIITPFRDASDIARGILTIPKSFTLGNFIAIWNSGLNIGFRNSMFFAISTCITTIIVGGLAGYGFVFLKFRFKNVLYKLIFSCIYIPIIIILIPLFMQYKELHLMDSFLGIIIIYTGIRIAFSVYLYRSYFEEFPSSIIDAAKIDGASEITILTKIIIPLSKAVTITIVIFNFMAIWADFLISLLFMQKANNATIMLSISNIFVNVVIQGGTVTNLATGYAGLLISTAPVILIYFFTRKYYLQGLTLGSIK